MTPCAESVSFSVAACAAASALVALPAATLGRGAYAAAFARMSTIVAAAEATTGAEAFIEAVGPPASCCDRCSRLSRSAAVAACAACLPALRLRTSNCDADLLVVEATTEAVSIACGRRVDRSTFSRSSSMRMGRTAADLYLKNNQ